jgi:hypothetical protein
MRAQPDGGVIVAVLGSRALTEAINTSPLAVVLGCVTVSVEPKVVALLTPPAGGMALKALPAPETARPRIKANPRKPM